MTDKANGSASQEESPLKFPCKFPIKAMGKGSETFEKHVVDIVQKHLPKVDRILSVKSKPSKQGKYQSVTVTFMAVSKDQLDAIYQDLTDSDDVIMSF